MPPEPVRIGLVEDDPVMGGSIVQRIELEGGTISWWKSGQQAIEAIAASSGEPRSRHLRHPPAGHDRRRGLPGTRRAARYAAVHLRDRLRRDRPGGAPDARRRRRLHDQAVRMDDFLKRIDDAQAPQERRRHGLRPWDRRKPSGLPRTCCAAMPDMTCPCSLPARQDRARRSRRGSCTGCRNGRRALHGGQLRRDSGRPPGERNLRPREGRLHRRPAAPSRLCREGRRGTLFLDEIGDMPPPAPGKAPAAHRGTAASSGWAAKSRCRSGPGSWRRPTASTGRAAATPRSARICISGWRSCRSRFPLARAFPTTSPGSWTGSSPMPRQGPQAGSAASARWPRRRRSAILARQRARTAQPRRARRRHLRRRMDHAGRPLPRARRQAARIRFRASGGCPRRRRAPPDRARPG
jgi:hypothetical protein